MKEEHSGESYFNKSPPELNYQCQVQESNYTTTVLALFFLFLLPPPTTSLDRYSLCFLTDQLLLVTPPLPSRSHTFFSVRHFLHVKKNLLSIFALLIASIMTFSNVCNLHSASYAIAITCSICSDLQKKQHHHQMWPLNPPNGKSGVSSPISIVFLPKASDAWHSRLLISHTQCLSAVLGLSLDSCVYCAAPNNSSFTHFKTDSSDRCALLFCRLQNEQAE